MNKQRSAFTFIEITVVLALIGVIAAVLLPRLVRRSPAVEWKNILDDFNNIVSFTRQEAVANQKVYRLTFKSSGEQGLDTIMIEEEKDDPDKPGKKMYPIVSSYYFTTTYTLAKGVKLSAVYIGKQNQLDEKGGAHCYIIPDGLVQDVIIRVIRTINGVESKGSFRMNPFMGTFEFFDGFIKPE